MGVNWQDLVALVIVFAAAAYLTRGLWRPRAKATSGGCASGGCGSCPLQKETVTVISLSVDSRAAGQSTSPARKYP
jgi:FeoB-associated Cys-rich membrane protein